MASDDDLSHELLALAGDGGLMDRKPHKSKSGNGSSSKKRNPHMTDDSDMSEEDPESEGFDDVTGEFPLEGKYRNAKDREYLESLPEIKREAILSARQEAQQKQIDSQALERMLNSQRGDDSVARAAKRKHTTVGSSKEKTRSLDVLKQRRQAKARRNRDSDSPPPKRQRSSSGSDDSESEDGQYVPTYEEQSALKPGSSTELNVKDLNAVRISRDTLERHCFASWFPEFVTGAFVRMCVGIDEHGQSKYRAFEVEGVTEQSITPYKLNNKLVNMALELRLGNKKQVCTMERISCSEFTEREFNSMMAMNEHDRRKPPSKSKIEKKAEVVRKWMDHQFTESDVAEILAKQEKLKTKPAQSMTTFRKSTLLTERKMAVQRNNWAEIKRIDDELAALSVDNKTSAVDDPIAIVNERNRKANQEAMRRAEQELLARRKAGHSEVAKVDLSARVKTVPKIRFGTPRSETPSRASPAPAAKPVAENTPASTASPSRTRSTIDALASSVVLDLEDF